MWYTSHLGQVTDRLAAGQQAPSSKVQQLTDIFLNVRNFRINVFDRFLNFDLFGLVVPHVRTCLSNMRRADSVALDDVVSVGIDWHLHDFVISISFRRWSVSHAQRHRDQRRCIRRRRGDKIISGSVSIFLRIFRLSRLSAKGQRPA